MNTGYLVQFGRLAYVGRFLSESANLLERGQRVVVRTVRGVELGVVLCPASERFSARFDSPESTGILRLATEQDRNSADDIACAVLTAAEDAVQQLGYAVTVLDCEALLEDGPIILHILPWAECDLDPLLVQLAAQFSRAIRVLDIARTPIDSHTPEPASGCGKPNCGSSDGGCTSCGTSGGCSSSGGCSRRAVKNSTEMTAYFRDLREKMQAASHGRTALN
ncbi:MAG: hypothetical protein LC104_02370 [Bacteroidales bacterium]|nr:hypothetical protein [Bacteroidales bacterium]